MSTHGLVGFRYNDQYKLSYNHYDSQPDRLGQKTLDFLNDYLKSKTINNLRSEVDNIRLVDNQFSFPSEEEIEQYKQYCEELNYFKKFSSRVYWHVLLAKLEGDIKEMLKAKIMVNSLYFLNHTVSCKWTYLIDLDNLAFQIYNNGTLDLYKSFDLNKLSRLPKLIKSTYGEYSFEY